MPEKIGSLVTNLKNKYRNYKNGDPWLITGRYDVQLHLHRRSTPEQRANLASDSNITFDLLDLSLVLGAAALIGAIAVVIRGIYDLLRDLF